MKSVSANAPPSATIHESSCPSSAPESMSVRLLGSRAAIFLLTCGIFLTILGASNVKHLPGTASEEFEEKGFGDDNDGDFGLYNNTDSFGQWLTMSTNGPPPEPEPPLFVYTMSHSGMGSQTLLLLLHKWYTQEVQNRSFVLDATSYHLYRAKTTVGYLKGFFTPRFPVMDNPKDTKLVKKLLPTRRQKREWKWWDHRSNQNHKHISSKDQSQPVWVGTSNDYGQLIKDYACQYTRQQLYLKLLPHACPNLQFNRHALTRIERFRRHYSVPDFAKEKTVSVAFHVRRTDKITTGEAKAYRGQSYVNTLVDSLPEGVERSSVQNCYIATDDLSAIPEITQALSEAKIPCIVHYIPDEDAKNHKSARYTLHATELFLTELYMLIHATYFVGSFGSNVGGFVALLRGCRHSDPPPHFGHSYGVDSRVWYARYTSKCYKEE